jgi:hypothetical protein
MATNEMHARTPSERMLSLRQKLHNAAHCPHCEYDRRFPGFEQGGWMQQDNNGPIVSCPMCNPDGAIPRSEH